ncbi:MAG TPA: ATP-binding protein, partial [Acholeplasmataceae bacterium]|nr:ATP-binding protein [Acholeplasmataceae bacterium]
MISHINQENIKRNRYDFENHRFIHQCENIVFMGTSGVSKMHLSTSIGISVAKKCISTNRKRECLKTSFYQLEP